MSEIFLSLFYRRNAGKPASRALSIQAGNRIARGECHGLKITAHTKWGVFLLSTRSFSTSPTDTRSGGNRRHRYRRGIFADSGISGAYRYRWPDISNRWR